MLLTSHVTLAEPEPQFFHLENGYNYTPLSVLLTGLNELMNVRVLYTSLSDMQRIIAVIIEVGRKNWVIGLDNTKKKSPWQVIRVRMKQAPSLPQNTV